MTWNEFQRKAVPDEIRRREAAKNPFVPFSRWVAVREAFFLHHLGVTGNMVSLFRLVLAIVALGLYARFAYGELWYAVAGIVMMAWQLNLDGVDGALARAQDRVSAFGDALDNLGIDFARTCFFVLVGAMTGSLDMVIAAVLAGFLLVPFRQHSLRASTPDFSRFDRFVRNFIYVPVLWVIVPACMVAALALGFDARRIAAAVAGFYSFLAIIWFLACLVSHLRPSAPSGQGLP